MIGAGAILVAALLVSPGVASAKKKMAKEAPPPAPVSVMVVNNCASDAELKVGDSVFKVAAGQRSAQETVAGREDWSFPVSLTTGTASDLGLLGLEPGGQYEVVLADCREAAANLLTRNLSATSKAKSPHSAARIRFRSRQNTHLDYRAGSAGAFKPLSMAMTTYREVAGGKTEFTFRLRAAKNGPVLKTVRAEIEVEPGRQYLIEANVVGKEVFFKREDEGFGEGT